MAKRGRPSSFDERFIETIVRLSEDPKMTKAMIAEVIGVSERTLTNWMGKHVELRLAVREARMVADDLVEGALFQRALGYSHPEQKVAITKLGDVIPYEVVKQYPPDTQAAMFWLRNRQPERWKEKTDSDVNVINNLNPEKLSDEQLEAAIAAYLGKQAPEPSKEGSDGQET